MAGVSLIARCRVPFPTPRRRRSTPKLRTPLVLELLEPIESPTSFLSGLAGPGSVVNTAVTTFAALAALQRCNGGGGGR
jgi:hypothetical protein